MLLAGFIVIGLGILPLLTHAPNRLVSGQPLSVWDLPDRSGALFLLPGLALLVGGFLAQSPAMLKGLMVCAVLFLAALIHVAALGADGLAGAAASAAARTSFGSGFWVMVVATALALADLSARAGLSPVNRVLVGLVAALPVVAMILGGHLDATSILREHANKADLFAQAVVRHIVIVVAALVPTLLIGVPLGVLAARRPGFGGPVLAALNIIQTVPSIALFGLLMAPLSALALAVPALREAGISGIGLAPAVIALTLYSVLPIVRNTAEGLAQVPRDVVEAARGMGMTDAEIFWKAEVPLALPVFLAGLRITVVQAIGLAAVAALIGAGGLGSIMFQGLFSNALDLVLLGALPIIAIAVFADAMFKLAVALTQRTAA